MDWKEVPHLFANGKFKLYWEESVIDIIEYSPTRGCYCTDGYTSAFADLEYCQLIARPISDMTDEEIRELKGIPNFSKTHCGIFRDRLSLRADRDTLTFEEARKLLSIGVYPFSQDDFGKTVININEI